MGRKRKRDGVKRQATAATATAAAAAAAALAKEKQKAFTSTRATHASKTKSGDSSVLRDAVMNIKSHDTVGRPVPY